MIKIASLRMKCAPSCFTAALHIVQSLLLQMITHPWKYYCTMIDRVSIFEMSKFCFSQGLQNWQHEHLQLILLFGFNWSPITSVHIFCFGRYIGEEHILLLWRCFSVFCAILNYMCFMLAGVEMCFVLADAAVFCGAECSEEPLWWGGDASRVRRGYTDVPAEESAPTRPDTFPQRYNTWGILSARHPSWPQLCKKVDARLGHVNVKKARFVKFISSGTSSTLENSG